MSNVERPPDDWERVAAELSAYRAAQGRVWGGLDELTVARVLAGTATPAEARRVTQTARDHPTVAQLLALLREVLGPAATEPVSLPPATVTVFRDKRASGGLILRHPQLDASGRSVSVVGPKSALGGGAVGDGLAVRLANRGLVLGRLTHLHPTGNTYRAEVAVDDVLRVGGAVPALSVAAPTGGLVWAGRRAAA